MGKKKKQPTEEFDHEAFLRQAEAVAEKFRLDVARPLQEFAETLRQSMMPVMEKFVEAMKQMHGVVYQNYLNCGAIYGETPEGFQRWLEELGEINRLEAQAQRIRQHHEDLADFKRRFARKRASSLISTSHLAEKAS
jgi:hypothetical protein